MKTIPYTDEEADAIVSMAEFCRKHVPVEQCQLILNIHDKTKSWPKDPESKPEKE